MVLTISEALDEMQLHMMAANLSQNTINDYNNGYRKFSDYITNHSKHTLNTHISDLKTRDGTLFMRHLATHEYTPGGTAKRKPLILSPKSRLNIHAALSSLWTMLLEDEFVESNIWEKVKRPKQQQKEQEPLNENEITALLSACKMTRTWHNKPLTQTKRLTATRDEALISLMLSSAIRVSELCDLKRHHINLSANTVYVELGKGKKSRTIPLGGRSTRNRIRKWYQERNDKSDYAFVSVKGGHTGEQMKRGAVLNVIKRLAKKAGIQRNVYPHLLRHTALTLLAKGGATQFQLMAVAGHTHPSMTAKYIKLAAITNTQNLPRPIDNI